MIRIGIPARFIDGRYVVNQEYVFALKKGGAETIVLLPSNDLDSVMSTLQGVLIPGGGDVEPHLYQEDNTYSEAPHRETDKLDLALIQRALQADLEIFGICRGLQVLNVAMGGSLIQDIPNSIKTELDHNTSFIHKTKTQGHLIKVLPKTRLGSLLPETVEVNSYHHQAIKKLAAGLTVSALAIDGIIEAAEGPKILAVQFHPERMIDDALFQGLFDDFVRRCAL